MRLLQGLRVVHKIAGVSIIRSGEAMESALKERRGNLLLIVGTWRQYAITLLMKVGMQKHVYVVSIR